MREAIILALAYYRTVESESDVMGCAYRSDIHRWIERHCAPGEYVYDGVWDYRDRIGKAFHRAMDDLKAEGIVQDADGGFGYYLNVGEDT